MFLTNTNITLKHINEVILINDVFFLFTLLVVVMQ